MTEDFQWSEETESKRFTVVLDADTEVSEEDALEAINRLVSDNNADESEDTGVTTDTRKFERGYSA